MSGVQTFLAFNCKTFKESERNGSERVHHVSVGLTSLKPVNPLYPDELKRTDSRCTSNWIPFSFFPLLWPISSGSRIKMILSGLPYVNGNILQQLFAKKCFQEFNTWNLFKVCIDKNLIQDFWGDFRKLFLFICHSFLFTVKNWNALSSKFRALFDCISGFESHTPKLKWITASP